MQREEKNKRKRQKAPKKGKIKRERKVLRVKMH